MKKEKNQQLFELWEKSFYDKYSSVEELQEEDFRSIAIGFFVANGCNVDESYKMYEYCISKGKF
jgi:hypothetical protein